ncbi:MAG: hypothetical protein GY792_32955 [Gammaproteobacteria bacterium]|nr:hypothetical protein [Gammaproteobacteria bacterium]
MNDPTTNLPDEVAAIGSCGYVVFTDESLPAEFRERFDAGRIPVTAIRHVRQWGLQVDDEFELPGHERTRIPDEEMWEVSIRARDGSTYEVNATLLRPAPE